MKTKFQSELSTAAARYRKTKVLMPIAISLALSGCASDKPDPNIQRLTVEFATIGRATDARFAKVASGLEQLAQAQQAAIEHSRTTDEQIRRSQEATANLAAQIGSLQKELFAQEQRLGQLQNTQVRPQDVKTIKDQIAALQAELAQMRAKLEQICVVPQDGGTMIVRPCFAGQYVGS